MNRGSPHRDAIFLLIASVALAQARQLAPEDVYRLQTVTDPQLSPDGNLVAYVVTSVDAAKNKRVSSIWMVPADGSGGPKPFLADVPARSPRWSPDGQWVAFLSNTDGKSQVWVIACDAKVRRPITHFANGVSRFSWSPDGTQLAVVARDTNKTRDVRHYATLLYKSDEAGWSDGITIISGWWTCKTAPRVS